MKQYEPIPSFTPDSHKSCKRHADYLLDCEFKTKEERVLLIKCLDNYIEKDTIGAQK